jgi:hypothetical protein
MKRIILTFFASAVFYTSFSQTVFPDFLQGTWKMDDKEIYEHWDKLNDNSMKGVSYAIDNEQIVFFEYLEIFKENDTIIYSATAVGQNEGRSIPFTMTRSDSIFSFENPQHDFPKIFSYHRISDTENEITISDGMENKITYTMRKVY